MKRRTKLFYSPVFVNIPTPRRPTTPVSSNMAGVRGRLHKSSHATSSASPRRSLRRGRSAQESSNVPEVFQDLISEAEASKAAGPDEDGKPLKKKELNIANSVKSQQP